MIDIKSHDLSKHEETEKEENQMWSAELEVHEQGGRRDISDAPAQTVEKASEEGLDY